ncbi:MAG: hypothetical protein ACRD47_08920 [Nitrososphaeraceae archaeon]
MTIVVRRDDEFTNLLKLNLRSRYEQKRRSEDEVHVSDIIPSSCIRKQYYSRRFPEVDTISDESIYHFIRGESSEFVITQLAKIGVSQANLEFDGILAHPDIMSNNLVVELKDTLNFGRLNMTDEKFKSYLRQLLYYLVIMDVERGIISIRYNTKELRWIKSDSKGDYFLQPHDGKGPFIESWSVHLPRDDIVREILRNEMVRRKNLFRKALEHSDVSILPRLSQAKRNSKCPKCNFYDRCMNEDDETPDAHEMANELDIMDISGVIDFRPLTSK